MGSTFVINRKSEQHHIWMPNSSTFLSTMEAIYEELKSVNSHLAASIEPVLDVNTFLDFSVEDWTENDFNILFQVVWSAKDKTYREITEKHQSNVSYIAIMELMLVLYFDERYRGKNLFPYEGEIRLSSDIAWQQPGWIFDFVIAEFIRDVLYSTEGVLSNADGIFESLIKAKSNRQLKIDKETDFDLQWYFASIDRLHSIYVRQRYYTTQWSFIKGEFRPAIVELNELFWKVNRVNIERWLDESKPL